jgi:hypothetical protein
LGRVEAFSKPAPDVPVVELFDSPNLLATAVYRAFYSHYPLRLSPTVVWLTILQGFAKYVETNAEAVRHKFVTHKDKELILILRPDFAYRSPDNDWESVFPQFASEIEKRTTPAVRKQLECDFSNTTPVDAASSHITLMSICQHYFEYRMMGGCGIPWIELLGTVQDWVHLREKAEGLREFGIASEERGLTHFREWIECLLPLLDQFVAAAQGRPDIAFWGSVCNENAGSGERGAPMTGWIQGLFPYMKGEGARYNYSHTGWPENYEAARNAGLDAVMKHALAREYDCDAPLGLPLKDIPAGITSAPVLMNYPEDPRVLELDPTKVTIEMLKDIPGIQQNLKFYAGLFALHQHPDGSLEPRTGWAVIEEETPA